MDLVENWGQRGWRKRGGRIASSVNISPKHALVSETFARGGFRKREKKIKVGSLAMSLAIQS